MTFGPIWQMIWLLRMLVCLAESVVITFPKNRESGGRIEAAVELIIWCSPYDKIPHEILWLYAVAMGTCCKIQYYSIPTNIRMRPVSGGVVVTSVT